MSTVICCENLDTVRLKTKTKQRILQSFYYRKPCFILQLTAHSVTENKKKCLPGQALISIHLELGPKK